MIIESPPSLDKHGAYHDFCQKALVPMVSFNAEFYGKPGYSILGTLYFFTPATTATWLYIGF